MSTTLFNFFLRLILIAAGLICVPSYAELGGLVNSEAIQTQTVQQLNVYLLKAPSGTQIKEYVNADNKVVAVTWQGPSLPNLQQLLGPYFKTFTNRSTEHSTSHRSAELRTDELVVESHGQMRNFAGRAYLPKMLPPEFSIDQIN